MRQVSAGGECGDCGSPGGSLGWPHPVARLTFDHCWLPGSNVGLGKIPRLSCIPAVPRQSRQALGAGCLPSAPPPYRELRRGSTMRVLLKNHRTFLYLPVCTHPSRSTLPAQAAKRQAFARAAGSGRPLPLARGSLCDGG